MIEVKNRLKIIRDKNKASIPKLIPNMKTKEASVLIALQYDNKNVWNILLTKRSMQLNSFPGQICFPGGNIEPNDLNEEAAAIREAKEEIGFNDLEVDVILKLPPQLLRNKLVHSVVGFLKEDFNLANSVNLIGSTEVEAVFFVPLAEFLSDTHYTIKPVKFKQERSTLDMNLPSFDLSIDGIILRNNIQEFNNLNIQIYGFTAINCIYVAMLVLNQLPIFQKSDIYIFAESSEDVYQDMSIRLKWMLQHFYDEGSSKVTNVNPKL